MTREERCWQPWAALLRERVLPAVWGFTTTSVFHGWDRWYNLVHFTVNASLWPTDCYEMNTLALGTFSSRNTDTRAARKFEPSQIHWPFITVARRAGCKPCRTFCVPLRKDRCQAITTLAFIPYPIFDKMLTHTVILLFSHILMTV